ncbi:MAG: tetratricopeptide repeat protein, partial [Nannocystaceae bacterium]
DPIAPCAPEKLAAHGLWQEPVRAEIRGALEAAETPLGEERWVAVDRILRDASRAHLGAVAQVCRDTASGQLESRQAEVRTECLAEQARLVRDRIDDLSHAGTETVVSAIEKLSFLPSPQACLQHPVAERAPEQKVAKLQRALDQSISQQLDAASSRERAGKYREALELTEAATAAAERGASDEIRAQAWTFQAMLETHLGRTSEAERSRERALRLAERTHQHDVWLSLVAAKVRSLGVDAFQTEDAQWWKDEALAGQKFDREPHPLRAAELEAARGDLLWVAGDLSQAIDAQRRALTIREKILGPRHLDVAQTLNDLGVALADDHQYNRAREVLERSLRIREAKLGHNHPFVASTLNNLGTILRTQGELSGARNALERSLAIKRYHWGGRHPHTARALHNLGRLAREQGDLEGAISSYQQALEIREAIHGKVHPDVATTLNAMAVALKKLGRRSEAKAAFERALAIRLEKYGSDHLKVASTHNSLGMLLVELGQPNQALAHFSRSVEIREKRLANDDPRFAWALRNLGHAALVVGDWPAARRHLSRVLPVDEVNLASGTANSSDLARTKFWLAQATEDHVGAPVLAQAARKL